MQAPTMQAPKISLPLEQAIQSIFQDTSKNLSDIKGREWSATNYAVAGAIGIATLSHTDHNIPPWLCYLVLGLVLIAHWAVIWRCESNSDKFRERLKLIVKDNLDNTAVRQFCREHSVTY